MGRTCIALDTSAPQRIQEAIKLELGEDHLDTHMSCLLEDTKGHACDGLSCAYGGPKGKKVDVPDNMKIRRNNPKSLDEPLALAAKRQAPKRKSAKAKGKKPAKAKGRRK